MEGVRSEDGMLNCAATARLAENPIPRSRKRLNPCVSFRYGSYIPYPVDLSFLIFNHSMDAEESRDENGNEERNGGQGTDG